MIRSQIHRMITATILMAIVSGIGSASEPAFVHQIQSATPGSVISIPAGEYEMSSLIVPSGVKVVGSGALETTLTILPGGGGIEFENVHDAAVSNLVLVDRSATAVVISHAQNIAVSRLLIEHGVIGIRGADSAGLTIENVVVSEAQTGLSINTSSRLAAVNNTIYQASSCGLSFIGDTSSAVFNNIVTEAGTGVTLGGSEPGFILDHNLYKTLYVGGKDPDLSRINVGTWTTLSGMDAHSVQLPVDFASAPANDFTPISTLQWDPSRLTVAGWGVASLAGVAAPLDDLLGRRRAGIPELGAVLGITPPAAHYAGTLEISSDDGRKSAGLFKPDGAVVRYIFQDLPLKKGRYGFVLPPYDQYGQPIAPGDYQIRVAEGNLSVKYLTLSANDGKNDDLQADSDSTSFASFSPNGDLLVAMHWGERGKNLISIDPAYAQPGRWTLNGSAESIGLCTDGKLIYYAKNDGPSFIVERVDPATGTPVPWDAATPTLKFPKSSIGKPDSLVCLDGRLYTDDTSGNRILGGDTERPAFADVLSADAPTSLTGDVVHHLLWFVSNQSAVVAIDPSGKTVARLTGFAHPVAVAVAGGRMAVADAKTGKVSIFSLDNVASPTLIRTIGTGDGPYGAYSATRFRFQEFRGAAPYPCRLALNQAGYLAVFDRWLSVFGPDGTVLHSSFSQFGNAARRVKLTTDGKIHCFDQAGHLGWVDDPKTLTWQPDGLYYVPDNIPVGQSVGFMQAGGHIYGVYDQDRTIGGAKQSGLAIVRFDNYIGKTVEYLTQSPTTHQFVVVHDTNGDGIIDEADGDGDAMNPQPAFTNRRWSYVDDDGSIRVMDMANSSGSWKVGYVFKYKGLDGNGAPIYDTDWSYSPAYTAKPLNSVYDPNQASQLSFGSQSICMPDGGMILGAFDKHDPIGCGLSNSGCPDLVRLTKAGQIQWFLPLNDYGPVQGANNLGNFILTAWGHQAEWIGLDPNGLQLGHFGFPAEAKWGGYWLDHPDHYFMFDNPDGTVSISAGDYARNGQHWLILSGAHTYVSHTYPLTLTANSFEAPPSDGKLAGYQILARAAQPEITITKLSAPLPIDGNMQKWRDAGVEPQITLMPHGGGISGPQDCCALVRLAYESNNLYVQVIRFDDVVTMHQPWAKSYLQDTTEMMVNGFMTGFQFSVSRYTDIGVGIIRRRFFGHNTDGVLPADHCPAHVTVYDSPKDIPERALIEDSYGVDLSKDKVLVMEYKLPIDDITYAPDTSAEFPVASGKTVWIGFMLDDNDVPGTDTQKILPWPANYNTFAGKEVSAHCTFE